MRNIKYFALVFIVLVSFTACTNEIDDRSPINLDLAYHPLFVGMERIYQMDSIIFDNDGQDRFETTSFIKEEITDHFISETGETIFKLELSWKPNQDDEWLFQRNWSTYISENRLIRNEENLRFIKLIFPPEVGTTWDGNNLFDSRTLVPISGENIEMFKNWNYQILERNDSEQVGLQIYPNVLTVQQADDENAIERRFSQEKYALDIGLVYREMLILDTQCFDFCKDLSWEEKAWAGFVLKQTLIEYN